MSIQNKKIVIGLFGFGVVGESLYNVLQGKPSLGAVVKRVCIRHGDKERSAPQALFTTHAAELLADEEINVIVELTSDPQAAYHIVTEALKRGKAVVSAGKKMISENLPELIALQQQYNVPLLYEAACCASIPVIRNLEEYYDNDLLHSVSGIVNGSTNYILTRQAEERCTFATALAAAQEAGFAEADPSLDVKGVDAAHKLSLLLAHAHGILEHPEALLHAGIDTLHEADVQFAREKGYVVKLVAQARKLANGSVAAFVLPQFVAEGSRLRDVRYEYNGVEIESSLADKQFFCGKGAGGYPTASAVLSDLSALRYDYRYEYKKLRQVSASVTDDFYVRVCVGSRSLLHIPHDHFERVEEWVSSDRRCHLSGIIHFGRLLKETWWKRPGISVILYPDAVHDALPVVAAFVDDAELVEV